MSLQFVARLATLEAVETMSGNNHRQDHLEDSLLRDLAGNDGVPVIDRDEEGANQ